MLYTGGVFCGTISSYIVILYAMNNAQRKDE